MTTTNTDIDIETGTDTGTTACGATDTETLAGTQAETGTGFLIEPISPAAADELRAIGGPRYRADAKPGFPCRQCLRDAEIGEELILVSHDPFAADSPYRSASPIFLHREPCGDPVEMTSVPEQFAVRQLSVRGFAPDAMMLDAAVIDGTDLAATLDRFFENPSIEHAHVHFAGRGCWGGRVNRR